MAIVSHTTRDEEFDGLLADFFDWTDQQRAQGAPGSASSHSLNAVQAFVAAHPAWPWQEEMLAIALHKTNVYFDLSGWSPRHFPPSLVRFTNSVLQDRALFGSDYPFFTPERWLRDFEAVDFKPEVRQKVLLTNAQKLLGL